MAKFLEEFLAKLSFINETPHLHIRQSLKTICRGDLEAMKQMGFQPDFKPFGKQKGEPGFRNELQQLGLQEKQL